MLKQRVLTALVLLPLALAIIFALPADGFLILLAILLLGGSREYSRLAGLPGGAAYMVIFLQAGIFAVLYELRDQWSDGILVYLVASGVVWLLMFMRLPLYQPGMPVDRSYRVVSLATGIASITTGWFALGWIRSQPEGSWLILLLLLIVWSADTGAYFAGRAFGKSRLAPHISPGKTWAGLVGGLVAALLVGLLAADLAGLERIQLVPLALVTALVSVGGDLLISLHKRISGCKDSGDLLPGHGGILDRVDSLLAAAPFFALGLLLTGT